MKITDISRPPADLIWPLPPQARTTTPGFVHWWANGRGLE
jgi:hypothetical protein